MEPTPARESNAKPRRRDFLRASTAALGGLGIAQSAHAAGSDVIRIGIIGCGGRGVAAAVNAMDADKGVRLVAMADVILSRVQEQRNSLKLKRPAQVAVDNDHCFAGFDAYKHVIESSDVVLIANAAKFHPLHMTAAIEAGKHVFVEKPHAIDPAGVKAVRAACELARRKNLCVISGLDSRYHPAYREAMQLIHGGAIGDIVSIEENFLRAPYVLNPRKPSMTEAEFQAGNQYHFHWLSGDDVPQSLIHNLDRASWALGDQAPLRAHGMGGRSTLRGEIYGSVFDHHAVVYHFAGGRRVYAFCRTIPDCYNEYSSLIFGTKGKCDLLGMRIEGEKSWQYTAKLRPRHEYEHLELFGALRAGKVINNQDYMTRSTLISVMGQISCYTGKEITWEQISASDFYFAPRPEECRSDMEPPVKPGPDGTYPVFVPGVTKLI